MSNKQPPSIPHANVIEDFTPLTVSSPPDSVDEFVGDSAEYFNEAWHRVNPQHTGFDSLVLCGPEGCGKTTVAKTAALNAEKHASETDRNVAAFYVDCVAYPTKAKATQTLAASANEKFDAGKNIPETGLSWTSYLNRFWSIIDENEIDAIVLVLDEPTTHDDDRLVYTLRKAIESGSTNAMVSIIAVTTSIRFKAWLTPPTESYWSMTPSFLFSTFDPEELLTILEQRSEKGFYDGTDAAKDGVLESIVDRAEGDASYAIHLLRHAAQNAEMAGDTVITNNHVEDAVPDAKAARLKSTCLKGLSPHVKCGLRGMVEAIRDTNQQEINQQTLYNYYQQAVNDQLDDDPVTWETLRQYLKPLREQMILAQSSRSKGHGRGSETVYGLTYDAAVIEKAVV